MPLALWLLDESALTQISEWVIGDHRRQSCDAPAAHRHDDLAAGGGVADVAAELVVQLTYADLTLERLLMWRHEAQCRRHIGCATSPRAPALGDVTALPHPAALQFEWRTAAPRHHADA
ncbi:MAG: hypothetical protein QOI48_3004 [Solirubrobacteraceae bacterium]|jgi:hypothetical protein|nr:hypothetical protein [Solirubrobacteraceae bacterium]